MLLTACLKTLGPEQRVKNLYNDLASAKSNEGLSHNFVQEFKLENLELPMKDYRLQKLKTIAEKKESETRLFLTIDLVFSKGKNLIEVRKIFELEKLNDDWKIKSIENVKTYIEAKEAIEIKKPL
jgi:hypothetical protein